jgi:hypothetical protein
LDFNFDGEITVDSDWCVFDLAFEGSNKLQYLNFISDNIWSIRNLPVISIEGDDVDQIQRFWFPLNIESGTPVTEITYGFELTNEILTSPPMEILSDMVESDGYEIYNSGDSDMFPEEPASGMPYEGGEVADPIQHRHSNFPNQEAGEHECAPTAVSNSLKYLNNRFELGLTDDQISIERMRTACGFRPGWGCDMNTWWLDKDAYMRRNDYNISTTRFFINKIGLIAGEIDKGQDVEMELFGHTVSVVGIVDHENGNYTITIAHDSNQTNPNGGCVVESGVFNTTTSRWTGALSSYRGINYFVVECPDLPEWDFHFTFEGCPGGILVVLGTVDCVEQYPQIFAGHIERCKTYEGYIPRTVDGQSINDLIFKFYWNSECNNEDHIKFASPSWNGETEQWELEEIPSWIEINLDGIDMTIPSVGDPSGEIRSAYSIVDLDIWLDDPRPPKEFYYISGGVCEDLPGYLIGTTPIVFNPNALQSDYPFSTTPLTGVLYNDAEIILSGSVNLAPVPPDIDGPPSGKANEFYDYTFYAKDPDGDDMTYHVEWDDGGIDEGFVESGGAFTLTHSWSEKGDYTIKAKLFDEHNTESDWATLDVTMPRKIISINTIIQHLFEQFPNMFSILRLLL